MLIIVAILFFLKPSTKPEQTESENTDKKAISVTKTDQTDQQEVQAKIKEQKELLAAQKAEREKKQKEEKARIEKENAEQIKMLIKKKSVENQRINIKDNKVPKVLNKKDARAEAKRKLLEQMQSDN